MRRLGLVVAALVALGGCATAGYPTVGLTHGISGRFHVLIGSATRVDTACRAIGIESMATQRVLGCYLNAGTAEFLWAADDMSLADTLAHEWRHSKEGAFHD